MRTDVIMTVSSESSTPKCLPIYIHRILCTWLKDLSQQNTSDKTTFFVICQVEDVF